VGADAVAVTVDTIAVLWTDHQPALFDMHAAVR
jgi:hypothetical protein